LFEWNERKIVGLTPTLSATEAARKSFKIRDFAAGKSAARRQLDQTIDRVQEGALVDESFFGLRLTNPSLIALGERLPGPRLLGEGGDAFLRHGDLRAHRFDDARCVGGHALDPVDFFGRLDRDLFRKKVRRQQRAELLELLTFALDDERRTSPGREKKFAVDIRQELKP
jgi:hypothetical protein